MEQYRDEFDPETLQILTRSFDLAWRYLQRVLEDTTADDRERLADIVMQIGRSGERTTIRIANCAVDKFSEEAHGRLRPTLTGKRQSVDLDIAQLQGGA